MYSWTNNILLSIPTASLMYGLHNLYCIHRFNWGGIDIFERCNEKVNRKLRLVFLDNLNGFIGDSNGTIEFRMRGDLIMANLNF